MEIGKQHGEVIEAANISRRITQHLGEWDESKALNVIRECVNGLLDTMGYDRLFTLETPKEVKESAPFKLHNDLIHKCASPVNLGAPKITFGKNRLGRAHYLVNLAGIFEQVVSLGVIPREGETHGIFATDDNFFIRFRELDDITPCDEKDYTEGTMNSIYRLLETLYSTEGKDAHQLFHSLVGVLDSLLFMFKVTWHELYLTYISLVNIKRIKFQKLSSESPYYEMWGEKRDYLQFFFCVHATELQIDENFLRIRARYSVVERKELELAMQENINARRSAKQSIKS